MHSGILKRAHGYAVSLTAYQFVSHMQWEREDQGASEDGAMHGAATTLRTAAVCSYKNSMRLPGCWYNRNVRQRRFRQRSTAQRNVLCQATTAVSTAVSKSNLKCHLHSNLNPAVASHQSGLQCVGWMEI